MINVFLQFPRVPTPCLLVAFCHVTNHLINRRKKTNTRICVWKSIGGKVGQNFTFLYPSPYNVHAKVGKLDPVSITLTVTEKPVYQVKANTYGKCQGDGLPGHLLCYTAAFLKKISEGSCNQENSEL